MINAILAALLGGFFGWVYGGNAIGFIGNWFGVKWKARFDAVDKVAYYIAYAAFFAFYLPAFSAYSVITLGLSQWARRAVSWGKYIGALVHGRIAFAQGSGGVQFIDELVFSNGMKRDHLALRCVVALGIIGGLGGAVLAAGLFIAFSLIGEACPPAVILLPALLAAKGITYWLFIELAGMIKGQTEKGRVYGWQWSEIAFNACMWLAVYLVAF